MDEPFIHTPDNDKIQASPEHHGPLLDGEAELSFELRQPFYMEAYHWHQQIEVNILYQGTLTYTFNHTDVLIESGQMAMFWAVTPHRVKQTSDHALMGIINIPLNMLLSWPLPQEFVQQIMNGGAISARHTEIVSFAENQRWIAAYREGHEVRNQIVQEEIFLMLRRLCSYNYHVEMFNFMRETPLRHANYTGYKNVQFMLDYIANNHNRDIKVEDIASHVKLHPKYAMSLFKNMLSVSIKQYLIIMRINHAKVLLGNTRHPIKNIATHSGFKHPSSFFAAFRNHTGMTPQAFREQSQQQTVL
ncbi:transcriptional regulator MelR [Vibrio spartinae]|uniref:Melibiose operon regulatory protein n=1 Tax=Vibrio spartinae TaxID=1918945 RepID=A0A1N6MAA0_9VIBR|nr:transcriptional regulator MelR [Vibrio spartinae]QMV16571.1 Melibiose operon regulatory protein [Vibrio spartinae]SIO96395.1 Melibiose operon regulatory protein [Vibrio spartinae]